MAINTPNSHSETPVRTPLAEVTGPTLARFEGAGIPKKPVRTEEQTQIIMKHFPQAVNDNSAPTALAA